MSPDSLLLFFLARGSATHPGSPSVAQLYPISLAISCLSEPHTLPITDSVGPSSQNILLAAGPPPLSSLLPLSSDPLSTRTPFLVCLPTIPTPPTLSTAAGIVPQHLSGHVLPSPAVAPLLRMPYPPSQPGPIHEPTQTLKAARLPAAATPHHWPSCRGSSCCTPAGPAIPLNSKVSNTSMLQGITHCCSTRTPVAPADVSM